MKNTVIPKTEHCPSSLALILTVTPGLKINEAFMALDPGGLIQETAELSSFTF